MQSKQSYVGPIQAELRRWCWRATHRKIIPALSLKTSAFYMAAAAGMAEYGEEPNSWEEVMSGAIEAAEALGL